MLWLDESKIKCFVNVWQKKDCIQGKAPDFTTVKYDIESPKLWSHFVAVGSRGLVKIDGTRIFQPKTFLPLPEGYKLAIEIKTTNIHPNQ